LHFDAPAECGDGSSFRRRVSELLLSRALHGDGLVVALSVERAASSNYQLSLLVQTVAGPAERQLQADNCEGLVRAAAAIVAFSLSDASTSSDDVGADSTTTTAKGETPLGSPGVTPVGELPLPEAESNPTEQAPPDDSDPAPKKEEGQSEKDGTEQSDDDAPTNEATPVPTDETGTPLAVWFLVGSKFDAGLLPSGAVSGRIGAGWGESVGVQLTISAALSSATTSSSALPDGRDYLRYALDAQVSHLWPLAARISAGALASVDIALVTAGGADGQPGATSTAVGSSLGGAAELAIAGRVRLRPEVELLIAARRAQFDTWEATAHDPRWIAPRFGARAGLALIATF
jgi:hypothetical protein